MAARVGAGSNKKGISQVKFERGLMKDANIKRKVAAALLDINAVKFVADAPLTLKSGVRSPLYVDNRVLPFHPEQWNLVLEGWQQLIEEKSLDFDCLAGIETAGIPHSATLGYILQKPSIFVRKKAKDHGTKSQIEGGNVAGKNALLIEDHVTTGGSSLTGVSALRADGAVVENCLSITWYDFPETRQAFEQADVILHTLTSVSDILECAVERNVISAEVVETVGVWLKDPRGWPGGVKA